MKRWKCIYAKCESDMKVGTIVETDDNGCGGKWLDGTTMRFSIYDYNANNITKFEEIKQGTTTSIEITTKHGNTHLLLKEDGKVVKHTQAILHKEDEYCLETGVRLCVNRLFGKEETKYDAIASDANIGDKIRIIDTADGCKGANDRSGVVTDKVSNNGWLSSTKRESVNVELENGTVWKINEDAKVKMNYKPQPKPKSKQLSDYTTNELLEEIKRRIG